MVSAKARELLDMRRWCEKEELAVGDVDVKEETGCDIDCDEADMNDIPSEGPPG